MQGSSTELFDRAAGVSADIDISAEGPGLKAIAHGFALVHAMSDHMKIELETPMYDARYAWCQKKAQDIAA